MLRSWTLTVLGFLALAAPALAHHSVLAFDGSHATTVSGVVTKLAWQNPHTYIFVDVKRDNGGVEPWTIESESPRLLRRLGWTKDLIRPGDTINGIGARARDGAPTMRCKVVELNGRKRLPCFPDASPAQGQAAAQAPAGSQSAYAPPRTLDGKPDMQGIWQASNAANWDLQDHAGSHKTPAGRGVVVDPVDGSIPYQPWARSRKQENFASREAADPLEKCYLAGVPRTMYVPFPFQILQGSDDVMILSEYVHTTRWIPLGNLPRYPGYESWMGDSRGRWDRDTLVVETVGFNDQTWFDHAGNFHSDALKVVERFRRTGPDTITYEATIEDPKVFTRPWTIRMPFQRRTDMDRILEYECYLYAEEAGKPIVGRHPEGDSR